MLFSVMGTEQNRPIVLGFCVNLAGSLAVLSVYVFSLPTDTDVLRPL